MHLEDFHKRLQKLADFNPTFSYKLKPPTSTTTFTQTENRLQLTYPEQVKAFYTAVGSLKTTHPNLEILPLEVHRMLPNGLLLFASIHQNQGLAFDTNQLNVAGQWSITTVNSGFEITKTMASFYSNKLWKWLEQGEEFWSAPF